MNDDKYYSDNQIFFFFGITTFTMFKSLKTNQTDNCDPIDNKLESKKKM